MLSDFRRTFSDPLFAVAWHRFGRLWRPMAAWTFLLWAVVVLLLVPLSSAIVTWQVGNSDQLVIGNEELITWLLTPAGVAYLLFAGSVAVVNWVLRYAGLFQIIIDDLEGRTPSLTGIALRLAAKIPTLLRFSLKAVGLALLAITPVIAGVWLIKRTFLDHHDINYFLSVKPRAWYHALVATGGWLTLCAGILAYLAGRIVLALPSWLDGYRGFFVALQRSWQLTRTRSRRLLRVLGLAAAGWIVARFALDAGLFAVAARVAEWISATSPLFWPSVAWAGAYLAGSVLLNVSIEFLGFSYLSVALTKFYFEDTPLHRAAPLARVPAVPSPDETRVVRRWFAPRRLIPVIVLMLTISAFVGQRLLSNLPEMRPVLVTAHRAGPPPAPENTLAALERSIAAGADFAEIDVLRTRDGVVVVAHDADLMRLARDSRRIADSTYAELRDVVNLPDDGSPPEERRLATLGDFLARAKGRIRLNIELKYYRWDPLLTEAVIGDIRARQMEQDVVLMSLNLEAVRQARRLAPDIARGYVSTLAVGNISRLPVDFVAVNLRRLTPQLIRDARQQGQQVHVWTVNTVAGMAHVMELGVDGIITDHPARAVHVRTEFANLRPVERLLLPFRRRLLEEASDQTADAEEREIDPERSEAMVPQSND